MAREMGQAEERAQRRLEDLSLGKREAFERDYQKNPKQAASRLVYAGYWTIAAQLKIDHAVGRLTR